MPAASRGWIRDQARSAERRHGWESCKAWKFDRLPSSRTRSFSRPRRRRAGRSAGSAALREDRRELVRFWPVVQNMVVQELRVRYQRSFLGFVWTLLNPILMMAILSWVFSHIMAGTIPNYPLFLFAGMVPWSFLSISLNDCAFSIIQNEGLIRKIYLPKLVFPLVAGADRAGDVRSLARCVVPAAWFLWAPGRRLRCFSCRWRLRSLAVFALGLGLIVATLNTFYRDCGHLIAVVSPGLVLRDSDPLSDRASSRTAQWRLRLNPAFYFIEIFHDILYAGHGPGCLWSRPPR